VSRDDEPEDDSMPGQDSFIDVICNMVGILITLVVVVGMRVSQMVIEPAPSATQAAANVAPAETKELQESLATALRARHAAADEIQKAMMQARDMRASAVLVDARRHQLTLVRAQVEQEIAERREKLDAESRAQFDVQREIVERRIRLDALTQEQISLASASSEVEEIEAVPTPIAKAVTGETIHVRLKGGRLALVPFNELLDEIDRRDASYMRTGLASRNEATDTYGPIDGFRLRVIARRYTETLPAAAIGGSARRSGIRVNLIILPTDEELGVAAEQAFLPDSAFSAALRERRSAVGAVTAWVYPDSYAELRSLKKTLWDVGMPLTVRPRLAGEYIVGWMDSNSSGTDARHVAQ
jgi:hypothetical protein